MKIIAGSRLYKTGLALAAAIVLLYFLRLGADGIAGMFGIFVADEGPYLLAAKNQILFGAAHLLENDRYQPEYIAPLLHRFALLTITMAEPLFWLRLGIGLQVVAGMALIARLAGKYHQSAASALACFLCLLLNPILFFYARIGLSEGMQFFLLALILTLLFRLHRCQRMREAAALAGGIGALTAVMLLAKVGAVSAGIGAGVGLLAALGINPGLSRKPLLAGIAALSGIIVVLLYLGALGQHLPDWIYANLLHAWNQLPDNADNAVQRTLIKMPYLAYLLSLMPVFALYLLSPLAADGKKRDFVFLLCLMTTVIIIAEFAITGSDNSTGSIRRNFFGLAMLSVVAGFTCREYMDRGITFSFRNSPLKVTAAVIALLYLGGHAFLLRWALQHSDLPYIVFNALFLLIAALAVAAASARLRCLLMIVAALASLAPMLFQAFFTPRTREQIITAVENIMPEDAFLIGYAAPWYLSGLRRKVIFHNCSNGDADVYYANPADSLPAGKLYFMGIVPMHEDACAPKDPDRYRFVTKFRLFIPENYGGLYGVSANWSYGKIFYLYEKR